MRVRVDQAGQDRGLREVDERGCLRRLVADLVIRPDFCDPVPFDQDPPVLQDAFRPGVEQPADADQGQARSRFRAAVPGRPMPSEGRRAATSATRRSGGAPFDPPARGGAFVGPSAWAEGELKLQRRQASRNAEAGPSVRSREAGKDHRSRFLRLAEIARGGGRWSSPKQPCPRPDRDRPMEAEGVSCTADLDHLGRSGSVRHSPGSSARARRHRDRSRIHPLVGRSSRRPDAFSIDLGRWG